MLHTILPVTRIIDNWFVNSVTPFRKRSSDSYNSHGKHSSTGTSQNGDQLTTSFVYNGNLNSQVVQISQTQYTKWKRIFSRQVLAADQIVIMETIGEGMQSFSPL